MLIISWGRLFLVEAKSSGRRRRPMRRSTQPMQRHPSVRRSCVWAQTLSWIVNYSRNKFMPQSIQLTANAMIPVPIYLDAAYMHTISSLGMNRLFRVRTQDIEVAYSRSGARRDEAPSAALTGGAGAKYSTRLRHRMRRKVPSPPSLRRRRAAAAC